MIARGLDSNHPLDLGAIPWIIHILTGLNMAIIDGWIAAHSKPYTDLYGKFTEMDRLLNFFTPDVAGPLLNLLSSGIKVADILPETFPQYGILFCWKPEFGLWGDSTIAKDCKLVVKHGEIIFNPVFGNSCVADYCKALRTANARVIAYLSLPTGCYDDSVDPCYRYVMICENCNGQVLWSTPYLPERVAKSKVYAESLVGDEEKSLPCRSCNDEPLNQRFFQLLAIFPDGKVRYLHIGKFLGEDIPAEEIKGEQTNILSFLDEERIRKRQ